MYTDLLSTLAWPAVNSATLVVTGLVALAGLFWLFQRPHNLPPGPAVLLPVLGHLLHIAKGPLQAFRELRDKYGDVFSVYLGNRLVIVVNGYDAITEILQTRGIEFTYRPPVFLSKQIADYRGLLNTSGTVWMEQRNNVHAALRQIMTSGNMLDRFLEMELQRLTETMRGLIKQGTNTSLNVSEVLQKSRCAHMFSLVYGRRVNYDSREVLIYMQSLDELFKYFGLINLVNFIPYSHLLPKDPLHYHRCIKKVEFLEEEVVKPEILRHAKNLGQPDIQGWEDVKSYDVTSGSEDGPFTDIDDQLADQCFVDAYLREMRRKRSQGEHTELSENQLIKSAGDLMAGGYESMKDTLSWLFLYLTHHPEVQDRCRQEAIQALRDSQGSVVSVDKAKLVFLQATIMEVQRLANVGPLLPAHSCVKDTPFRGHVIPKDALVQVNLDSLMVDPELVDCPEEFRPERFISPDGSLFKPRWFMPFSKGVRVCIGAQMAKKEMLCYAVSLLSAFVFKAPKRGGVSTENGRGFQNVDGQEDSLPPLVGDLGLTNVPRFPHLCVEAID